MAQFQARQVMKRFVEHYFMKSLVRDIYLSHQMIEYQLLTRLGNL